MSMESVSHEVKKVKLNLRQGAVQKRSFLEQVKGCLVDFVGCLRTQIGTLALFLGIPKNRYQRTILLTFVVGD